MLFQDQTGEGRDFRRIFECAGVGLACLELDGRIFLTNPALREMLGRDAEELQGATLQQITSPDDPAAGRLLEEVRQGPRHHYTSELRLLRKDGPACRSVVTVTRVPEPRGYLLATLLPCGAGCASLRALEQQLTHSQKLEAVGRLAGGAAHDFNNMLTAIRGYAELLLRQMEKSHPYRRYAEGILATAERCALTTRQLLVFSRREALEPRLLDLNEVVKEIADLLQRVLGEDLQLVTRLAAQPCLVRTDPGQLEQILMNLAVNARDAMPNGGRLAIETQNVELDESYAATHLEARPGPHVMLAVSDTGRGMDASTRAHLFEPFFTTKQQGQGTGLGLATVYDVVKQSGGCMWVYSEVGEGATFKIYLPRARPEGEEERASLSPREVTILVIEDDEAMLQMVCDTLRQDGHQVLAARGGDQALTLCQQHAGPIHLLLTDVTTPGTNGQDLAGYLAMNYPGMKTLYMSGFTEEALTGRILDREVPFVEKPFRLAELCRKIREMLEQVLAAPERRDEEARR